MDSDRVVVVSAAGGAAAAAVPASGGERARGGVVAARGVGGGTVALVVAALAMAGVYVGVTGQVWEDYLITFRHARNLVEGNGLVYNVGERVHGFTSPLGVLLPALFHWVAGSPGSPEAALWMFRGVSVAAFAGALAVCVGTFRRTTGWVWAAAALAVLLLLDVKGVEFSVNGQETAFMLLFVAWTMRLLAEEIVEGGLGAGALGDFKTPAAQVAPTGGLEDSHGRVARGTMASGLGIACSVWGVLGKWVWVGVAWAGLLWTRPDGCVFVAATGLAAVVTARGGWRGRWETARGLVVAGVVCAALYGPWFAWAWWYYGSPVPNTVRAKSKLIVPLGDVYDGFAGLRASLAGLPAVFQDLFVANFGRSADAPAVARWVPVGLGVVAGSYWLVPRGFRLGRWASLAFLMLAVYFCFPARYGWYLPPVAMLGYVVVASAAAQLGGLFGKRGRVGVVVLLGGVYAVQGWMFVQGTYCARVQQREIEEGTRKQIGLWLRERVRPGDRVYIEPLGYVGYYSGARMMDYPGLVAPEVVRLNRRGAGLHTLVPRLKPEWIVARPWEAMLMRGKPYFVENYRKVAEFDARERVARYGEFLGKGWVVYDSVFYVYERVGDREP